jgi:RNA polymerase sigma factor (sigma-70 family)
MTKTSHSDSWNDNFDALLNWLGPDRESAGRKYEEIRHALILIFEWRGYCDAEDLADETITRVMNKVPEIADGYIGDPALYFYAVAKLLVLEVSRRYQARVEIENLEALPDPHGNDERNNREEEYKCLDKCLETLPPADRELILSYYQQDQPKIRFRRDLAQRYDVAPNALRVKVHRIRATLNACINKCLGKRSKVEME